jgi:hypothetical protein
MLALIDAAKAISTSYPDVLMDDAQVGKPPARFRSANPSLCKPSGLLGVCAAL